MASPLMVWYRGLTGSPEPGAPPSKSISVAKAAGHATAGALEAAAIGTTFGLLSANMTSGLDLKIGETSVPLDIVGGAVASAASAILAGSHYGAYVRTAADATWAVAGFRHGEAWGAAHSKTAARVLSNKAAKIAAAGEDDSPYQLGAGTTPQFGAEDPILAWARTDFAGGE